MHLMDQRSWICPECRARGMLSGTSVLGSHWAECLSCGITQDYTVVHHAQQQLRQEEEGGITAHAEVYEPALD